MVTIRSIKKGRNYPRICMITGPLPDSIATAAVFHVTNLLRLLEPLAGKIFIISSNLPEDQIHNDKIHVINIKHKSNSKWMFIRIPKFVIMQLKICYHLFKIRNRIDILFFSIGAAGLFLPMISAKWMRKKAVIIHQGIGTLKVTAERAYSNQLFGFGRQIYPRLAGILETLNYYLSDRIIVQSSNLNQVAMKKLIHKKLVYGSRFFVDANFFKIKNDVSIRKISVGFIGGFSNVKGILNFVDAIPLILQAKNNVKFFICGDGPLRRNILLMIKNTNLQEVIAMTGWTSHDEIPNYLNKLKLLVIPSYTEVGPQLLFEAMACGTPTLVPPVGIVPDVIKDGETGFIIGNNSPECIAQGVVRALNHSNFNRVAKAARELVEKEYTYEAAVERYRSMLSSMN